MSDSYTVLWTKHHCDQIRKQKQEGTEFKLLFGGPHSSEPPFIRYGVKSDDWIYPVYMTGGVLYVIGRIRVARLISYDDFLAENPDGLAEWWQTHRADVGFLMQTCTDQVAIAAESSSIRLDRAIPSEVLERMRFRSQKAERGLKYIENGKLKSLVSLHGGVYRMTEETAKEIADIVMNTP